MCDRRGDIRSNSGPLTERSKVSEKMNKELDEPSHTHWIAIGVLAAAIGGLCSYGYPTLRHVPGMLAQLPGFQKSLERVSIHLAEMEAVVKDWGRSQQELQELVAKLNKQTAARFQASRKQVQGLKVEIQSRVHDEVAAETQEIETQLSQVQAKSAADRANNRANVERLETEVMTLQEETVRQAGELRNARSEFEREYANRNQQLASLNEQMGRDRRDADDLAKKLAVKRIDFEVNRGHKEDLAEGVSLDITGTDVCHRRANGWMWLMPDRRTIWLRGQAAQQPVIFYGYPNGKRRELVITNVTKNSVTGYLILPADTGSYMTAALSKGE